MRLGFCINSIFSRRNFVTSSCHGTVPRTLGDADGPDLVVHQSGYWEEACRASSKIDVSLAGSGPGRSRDRSSPHLPPCQERCCYISDSLTARGLPVHRLRYLRVGERLRFSDATALGSEAFLLRVNRYPKRTAFVILRSRTSRERGISSVASLRTQI